MNSISNSNDFILKVSDLSISFNLDIHLGDTLRDHFVKLFTSPAAYAQSRKKRLDVLGHLDFEVGPGEKVGILGINGAGKTSLCRAIAGMYCGSEGKIDVRGTVRSIFDTSVGIIPELTGRENCQLMVSFLYPEHSAEIQEEIVAEALNFSELGPFCNVAFNKYSKGMQARLCLSMVSAKPCDLLILDEVFDGADEFFQKKISNRILSLIEKSGAVLFVSHSPEQIKMACNRVIILAGKKIHFDGEVDEGIDIYRNIHPEEFKL